ncbi:hypothetical protein E2320_021153, partial [Naja naja]
MPEATHSNQPSSSTWKVPVAPSRTGPNKAGLVAEKCPCFTQTLVKLFSLDLAFLETIPFSAQKQASKAYEKLQRASVRRSKAQVNGNSPETVLKIICLGKRRGWRNLSLKPSINAYRMRWRRELAPVHPTDALK